MARVLAAVMLLLVLPAAPLVQASVPISAFGMPQAPSLPATPPYAFNGAYADYTLTYYTEGKPYVYISNYTIADVSEATQTFNVTTTYNSYFAPFDSVDNASFQAPIPFPAASPSQLMSFREGKPSGVYQGDIVTPDVTVNVTAGTFVTYQLVASVSTVWFDVTTGLLVQERGLMLGGGAQGGTVGLVLASTNIKPATGGTDDPPVLQSLLVAAAAACVTMVLALDRRRIARSASHPGGGAVPT